jgi:hypothetical protein
MVDPRSVAFLGLPPGRRVSALAVATLGFLPLFTAEIPYEPTPRAGGEYRLEAAVAHVTMFVQEAPDGAAIELAADWSDDDEEVLFLFAGALTHDA